jgi:hypothetical protein
MPTLVPVAGAQTSVPSSGDWIAGADAALAGWVPAALNAARAQINARCVDGQIIGTGQADFTQGNTVYTLRHEGRTFQLIDVPGIEGDERRFAPLVAQAIAKSHLVFFVNGTNKKPEATTVQKIRHYLGRGTQVCVLVNVKEYADAYEFEEDRIDLMHSTGPETALRQTEEALAASLGPAQRLDGKCVQGLLAFSALALEPRTGRSTLHPSRHHDLGVHQAKYLRAFGSAQSMRRFSRIDDVAAVLTAKAQTFRADIIEANKSKVRELLAATLEVLNVTLQDHRAFMARAEIELATGKSAVDDALASFSRLALSERLIQVDRCFTALDDDARAIVSRHFGDQVAIGTALQQAFSKAQDLMVQRLESALAALLGTLEADLHRAVERLLQNLQRADFEGQLARSKHVERQALHLDLDDLEMNLGLAGWGRIVFGVGSMAITGAQFGLAYPPWGVFIGAGVGLIVGAVLSVVGLFTSQEKKIRIAHAGVQSRLDGKRAEARASATRAHDQLMAEVRGRVAAQVRSELERLHDALALPGRLVEQQMKAMGRILRHIEEMPHGTVQAVRV